MKSLPPRMNIKLRWCLPACGILDTDRRFAQPRGSAQRLIAATGSHYATVQRPRLQKSIKARPVTTRQRKSQNRRIDGLAESSDFKCRRPQMRERKMIYNRLQCVEAAMKCGVLKQPELARSRYKPARRRNQYPGCGNAAHARAARECASKCTYRNPYIGVALQNA